MEFLSFQILTLSMPKMTPDKIYQCACGVLIEDVNMFIPHLSTCTAQRNNQSTGKTRAQVSSSNNTTLSLQNTDGTATSQPQSSSPSLISAPPQYIISSPQSITATNYAHMTVIAAAQALNSAPLTLNSAPQALNSAPLTLASSAPQLLNNSPHCFISAPKSLVTTSRSLLKPSLKQSQPSNDEIYVVLDQLPGTVTDTVIDSVTGAVICTGTRMDTDAETETCDSSDTTSLVVSRTGNPTESQSVIHLTTNDPLQHYSETTVETTVETVGRGEVESPDEIPEQAGEAYLICEEKDNQIDATDSREAISQSTKPDSAAQQQQKTYATDDQVTPSYHTGTHYYYSLGFYSFSE